MKTRTLFFVKSAITAIGASLFAIAGGCSLFSNLDDFASEDPPAPSEAGVTDGPTTTPDVDAANDAPASVDAALDGGSDGDKPRVNLHPHPDFDLGGCGGWATYKGVLSPSSTAHSGTGSCRVCADGTSSEFTADDNGAISATVGVTYEAEVWVRTDPQEPVPPYLGLTLRSRNDAPFAEPEKNYQGLNTAVDGTWRKITTTLKVTKPAQTINVVVGGGSGVGMNGCFLLDDVALYKID